MNGLFGNFQSPMKYNVPQQNVANYLRMPVAQAAPQQQYPSIGQIMQAAYPQPQQDPSWATLQRISGYGTPVAAPETPANQPLSNEQKIIQHISGGYNATTTS